MKHFKKIIVSILIFCIVFLSFPQTAHASIYGDDITDYDAYFLETIENIKTAKNIYSGADKYLLMDFSEYYILLFSQNTFYTTTFTHSDGVTYTGICGGGWFYKSKDYNWSDNPDDWELVSFSNDNYAIEKIDTNIITYISANGQSVIANTTRSETGQSLEKKAVVYLYCTQDIEGFCSAGSNYVEPEPSEEEQTRGFWEKILCAVLEPINDFLGAIVGFLDTLADLLKEVLSFLFIPDDFEGSLNKLSTSIKKSFGMENVDFSNIIGEEKAPQNLTINLYGQSMTILDFSYLSNFLNDYRKYIRAFFGLMLILYNINQIMKFTKQSDNTGGEDK